MFRFELLHFPLVLLPRLGLTRGTGWYRMHMSIRPTSVNKIFKVNPLQLGWPGSSPSSLRRSCDMARARTFGNGRKVPEIVMKKHGHTPPSAISHHQPFLWASCRLQLPTGSTSPSSSPGSRHDFEVTKMLRTNQAQATHDQAGLPLKNGLGDVPKDFSGGKQWVSGTSGLHGRVSHRKNYWLVNRDPYGILRRATILWTLQKHGYNPL